MDVLSMNKYFLALGEICVRKPSQEWIADGTNDHKYKGLKFISRLIKLMSPILVWAEKGHAAGTDNIADNDHLSMPVLLIKLLELSHLLLVLYRESKGQFLVPQNYRNWQDSIKYVFI